MDRDKMVERLVEDDSESLEQLAVKDRETFYDWCNEILNQHYEGVDDETIATIYYGRFDDMEDEDESN